MKVKTTVCWCVLHRLSLIDNEEEAENQGYESDEADYMSVKDVSASWSHTQWRM